MERFFKRYGRLRDCLIKNGYGFVEFEDERDADDAVYEMNGRELLGERVTVEHARGLPRRSGYLLNYKIWKCKVRKVYTILPSQVDIGLYTMTTMGHKTYVPSWRVQIWGMLLYKT